MEFKITCLGVGNGTSYALRGNPSSSFLVSKMGAPYLLVDCGLGVGLQYKKYIGKNLPKYTYISHNHIDHSGELPVLLLDYYKKAHQTIIASHSEVTNLLKTYRLHELKPIGIELDQLAEWRTEDKNSRIELENGVVLSLKKSKHSYPCYSFRLEIEGELLIGYSGDSGYDEDLYDFISPAKIMIVDGRAQGNKEHASIEEIKNYSKKKNKKIYIIHHDSEIKTNMDDEIIYLQEGLKILIESDGIKS